MNAYPLKIEGGNIHKFISTQGLFDKQIENKSNIQPIIYDFTSKLII